MTGFSSFNPLDVHKVPLDGVNLVEANAGTGKTYNIVSLYLRLLFETALTVDQILVVSFTEAATAELRERVRKRLRQLQRVFETGSGDEDDMAFLDACPEREKGLRQIVRALQSFDQAAIFTIHGFCQRLLSEAAFEAGLSQTTELITDDDGLRRQLISDFWHAETATGSSLWINHLLGKGTPLHLYDQLAKYFARPLMRRITPPDPGTSVDLEQVFTSISRQAHADWPEVRSDVAALLRDPALNLRSYGEKRVNETMEKAEQYFSADSTNFKQLVKLERLGNQKIETSTKKNCNPPTHPFFDLMQQLLDAAVELEAIYSQRLTAMRARLLDFADLELPRRKLQRRVRHFDDLLTEVHQALQSPQAGALRQAAIQQYSAALIDEFQDTDPLQFSIFDNLFCKNKTPVFFVGDPKQAIYGFRGADVYAYLDARNHATRRFRLDLNYRSTPRLVESINNVFLQSPNPFVIDQIGFSPSAAARDKPGLIIDGKEQPAMSWWHLKSDTGKLINKSDAEQQIAASVATEIASLMQHALGGQVMKPGGERLEAKDIAVLVNSHQQGRMIRDALEIRGVGCMQRTDDNVFQTQEADELWYLLRAVVEPSRHTSVRAALATGLLGYDAGQIDALEHDDSQWQDLLDRFAVYPEMWRQHGFSRMYRRLMQDFDVERRVLSLKQGQRRLTNLQHLADLLQRESNQRHGRLEEVLVWMQEQKKVDRPSDQTMLLRLDSDENLVSIMTVHFSKGLQFPVVFCPYLWSVFSPKSDVLVEFHDDSNQPTLDLHTSKDSNYVAQAEAERLAERVRLTYVALTRAELACFAVWCRVKGTNNSSLNWLLQLSSAGQPDIAKLKLPSDSEIESRLAVLDSNATITGPMPLSSLRQVGVDRSTSAELMGRVLQNAVPAGWRVSSFSALTRHVIEEPRDYDAGKSVDKLELLEPSGIFAFPRGARAGRCMHALLERIEFNAKAEDVEPVAQQALIEHGYDLSHSAVLTEMAGNVMTTALDDAGTIRLSDVSRDRRAVEMEFYFPTVGLDADALRDTLGEFGSGTSIEQRLEHLEFQVSGGFMHGYIDLIFEAEQRFYVVDYKSNWLGNEPDDYRADLLSQEIAKHDYYLQYLIYSVALHRYLRRRLPGYDYDRHFGGAYYLFLRGMHPNRGCDYGVFHDRPDRELMRRLEVLFCRQEDTVE